MSETLRLLSIISFSVAGVSLVLSAFFWFFFKIPNVIGDLTGRTARKSIAKMRAANEKTGTKSYMESKTNARRGKLTGTMPDTSEQNGKSASEEGRPDTGLLAENQTDTVESEETEMLDYEETGIPDREETGLLTDEDATVPLESTVKKQPSQRTGGIKLNILDNVVLIHTDEVIE